MNNQESSNAKFSISNWKLFQKSINPTEIKKFSIGLASKQAVENMTIRIVSRDNINDNYFSIDAPYSESTVRKAVKDEYISQTALHGILCLFFHEFQKDSKYDIEYKKEHIQSLLKSIKLVEDEKGSIKRFRDFFAQLVIPKRFGGGFEIMVDENWEFSIIKSSQNEENQNGNQIIETNIESDQITPEVLENNIGKDIKEEAKETTPIKNNSINKWNYLILLIMILGVGYGTYYVVNQIQENAERDQKLLQESNINANANAISQSRNILLTDLYRDINDELESDYDNDGKRNLSRALIARIISLSEEFKPYKYLKDGKVIEKPLSPERAKLFLNLFNNKMDDNNFFRIISNANFTYSDFSNKNLNGLNLAKPLSGIVGHYSNEVNILITPIPVINFKHSDFRGANLDNVTLFGIFSYCDFRDISSNRIKVLWSDLNHCNFQKVSLKNCRFENTKLNHTDFSNSTLGIGDGYDKGFMSCDLRGAIFDNSNFSGGHTPFEFDNCFFSSTGTFFTYRIIRHNSNQIHLFGEPYIDYNDNFHPQNMYEILSYSSVFNKSLKDVKKVPNKIPRFINSEYKKTQNIALNTNFRILNKWNYNEKSVWDILNMYSIYVKEPVDYLNYLYVRTNDNINRNRKVIRRFERFYDTEWNDKDAVISDTLIVRSKLNNLQSEYRGIIYNHKQTKDSLVDGIASFKNCSFTYTHFSNSSMEFVNFNNSTFIKYSDRIENQFNNIKLKKNDMRIKSGAFIFSKETSYNNLLINDNFPLLKFILNKSKLIGGDYNKQYKEGKTYKASGILTVSGSDKKQLLEWIKINEKHIQLDSTNQKIGDYVLKNTSIKVVKF